MNTAYNNNMENCNNEVKTVPADSTYMETKSVSTGIIKEKSFPFTVILLLLLIVTWMFEFHMNTKMNHLESIVYSVCKKQTDTLYDDDSSIFPDEHTYDTYREKTDVNNVNSFTLSRHKREVQNIEKSERVRRDRQENENRGKRKKDKKKKKKRRHNRDDKEDKNEVDVEIIEETIVKKTHLVKAMHMHIDSKRSQPNEPDLKTGPQGSVIGYWEKSDAGFNYDQKFATFNHNGTVTIDKDGLYMIYSQITFFDSTGRWSYVIDIDGSTYVKCLASEWGLETNPDTNKYFNTVHQCYTSAVAHIRKDQLVSIKSMYEERRIHPDSNMSFWGLIHLS